MQPLQIVRLVIEYSSRIKLAGAYHHVAKRAEICPVTAVMLSHQAINIELIVS